MLELGVTPEGDSPASFANYVSNEVAKWKRIIEVAKVPKI
jgi:tripartite-type tricarboxylate transporter receptor subunit TctC